MKKPVDPTPEQIAERAAEIRANWTPKERRMHTRFIAGRGSRIGVRVISTAGLSREVTEEFCDDLRKWPYLNDYEAKREQRRLERRHAAKHLSSESGLEALENKGVDDTYVEPIVVQFGEQVSSHTKD